MFVLHLLKPVLHVHLHLCDELLLVHAKPGQGLVCPLIEPLVQEPARGLRDDEHQEGHQELRGEK